MSPPIDIDGSEIQRATIDGVDVSEITIDGQQTAGFVDIPDSEGTHEWLVDEGTGTTAVDRVGNADATVSDSWVSGVGVGNFVLDIQVSSDEFRVPQADLSDVDNSGSFLLVVSIDDVAAAEQPIWWSHDVDRFYLRVPNGGGGLELGLGDDGNITTHGIDSSDITDGVYYGIGIGWGAGSYDLLLYDLEADTTVASGSGTYNGSVNIDEELGVGCRVDGTDLRIGGAIDFPRFYDQVFGDSGISSRFADIAEFYP